jgi:hypothetical protein
LKTLSSTVHLLPRIILKLFNRIEGDYAGCDGVHDNGRRNCLFRATDGGIYLFLDDLRQLKLSSDKTPQAGVRVSQC